MDTMYPPPVLAASCDNQETKIGRPKQWTPSRLRKLARLYLFSKLPPKYIPDALKDGDWIPGKESVSKELSTLLDKQPRWLRAQTTDDLERRIAGLSECKIGRQSRRKLSASGVVYDQKLSPSNVFTSNHTEPVGPIEAKPPNISPWASPAVGDSSSSFNSSQAYPFSPNNRAGSYHWEQSLFTDDHLFPDDVNFNTRPLPDLPSLPLESIQGFDAKSQPLEADLSSYLMGVDVRAFHHDHPSKYMSELVRLIEAHSISDSSAGRTHSTPSTVLSFARGDCDSANDIVSLSKSVVSLPNVFLLLDYYLSRQGLCIPGLKAHDSKSCWCAVVVELSNPAVSQRVWNSGQGPPEDIWKLWTTAKFFQVDDFGNTILHLLAARGSRMSVIVDVIQLGIDINATNMGGQTFLHMLSQNFFVKEAEDNNDMLRILRKLHDLGAKFNSTDHLGRTFLHILTYRARSLDLALVPQLLQDLELEIPSSRDAFGWVPTFDAIATTTQTRSAATAATTPPSSGGVLMSVHARLLELVRLSMTNSRLEDAEGRNGLHCLAEVSLSLDTEANGISTGGSKKRKHEQLATDTSSSRFRLRKDLVQQLLDAGVDVNHYNTQGNNVLMQFITHLADGEDDRLVKILLNQLIVNGANIHARNRLGETALHIAVRLGRKVATETLLENGANVHTRTADGKGILVTGEAAYFAARDDIKSYASIMACMALAYQYGAVYSPSLVQEWSKNEGFATWLKLKSSIPLRIRKSEGRRR
ncbi:ankyrin repeat-containing domain protein [Bisporella sp. PMI_857]|nr:ankyrin repeat-containing domain protein [Bisporella sp. PMI_857]